MKYWINVVSKDHVVAGIAGGFVQAAGHRVAQFALLAKDDVIFFYSPGTLFRHGEILQAFTAIARVTDAKTYTPKGSSDAQAVRRNVVPLAAQEALAATLVPELECMPDKTNWAITLRRTLFEIGEADAQRIAAAMQADLTA